MIIGDLTLLRQVESQDLDNWVIWFNDPESTQYLSRIYPYGKADAENFWKKVQQSPNEVLYSIVLKKNKSYHIGSVSLKNIDLRSRNAELSILIGPREYWGNGYGRDAVEAMCRFAFAELGLRRIYLFVRTDHEGGIKAYEKVGFQKEGVARKQLFRNGRFWDLALMGLLAEDLGYKPD